MSRTQIMPVQPVPLFSPIKDVMQRHESGVTKNRKTPLTGSGRAWRDDEEAYLLQTRMQKMPYKHIAAHLNKTELACRLHYHQLSHGSGRRKRTTSCSSGSSHPSPSQPAASASPIYRGESRSMSPSLSGAPYLSKAATSDMQLSRIMSVERSPRLPAILPKPENTAYITSHVGEMMQRHPMVHHEQSIEHLAHVQQQQQHHGSPHSQFGSPAPSLRLDCSRLSPPSASVHTPAHVDLARLRAIYEAHKSVFWNVIAEEYGIGASAGALEQAWRTGACCQSSDSNPITPVASPDKDRKSTNTYRATGQDRTRISSILDDDNDARGR